MNNSLTLLVAVVFLFASCKKDDDPAPPSGGSTPAPAAVTVSDVDGNTYATVLINGTRWMKVNLRTTHYTNGDAIVNDLDIGDVNGIGAYGEVDDDANNAPLYGRLYNQNAVRDPRGLCPSGWHLSTDADWQTLESSLGMPTAELGSTSFRGTAQNVGGKLKSQTSWNSPNTGASDQVGFKAVPAGSWGGIGAFAPGVRGIFWTSTVEIAWNYYRELAFNNAGIGRNMGGLGIAYSCRCVQD